MKKLYLFAVSVALLVCLGTRTAPREGGTQRMLVFISDTHFGLGKTATGAWNPKEDFRWSQALSSFLDAISKESGDRVELVIAGDFLELWQFPAGMECTSRNRDLGCTVAEVERLVQLVVAAHEDDFAEIGRFAGKGENRVVVVPGNHDAALLIKPIWRDIVLPAFKTGSGRVVLEEAGVWSSGDGLVVAEHGHQIWPDVNRYERWPRVTQSGRMIRPWGEYFVQRLYNDEEDVYPLIDNLVPSSAGVRYRMRDRGFFKSAADLGRFLAFVSLETSYKQKVASLGRVPAPGEDPQWDLTYARNQLGARLFIEGLANDDPLRQELLLDANDAEARQRVEYLNQLARDPDATPDDLVGLLCDHLAVRAEENSRTGIPQCRKPELGYAAHKAYLIPRERVLRKHLSMRIQKYPRMRAFVYGHTHAWEEPQNMDLNQVSRVIVANTGTFQRLVDDEKLKAGAASRGIKPLEELKDSSLGTLAPCHTAVVIKYSGSRPRPELRAWHDAGGGGSFVSPCSPVCAKIGKACQ